MNTTRPTPEQIDAARALRDHYADQALRHERNATNALLGLIVAVLVACAFAWVLLTWADCTASGAAMCLMTMTPTRPGLWPRLCRAVRHYFRAWKIRWAEDDIKYLQEDYEAAQQWVSIAPIIIANRQALLDDLRVRDMADQARNC